MTGPLLSGALALLLWPDPRGMRRTRLAVVVGRQSASSRPRVDPPLAAAVLAGGVGALTSPPLVAVLAAVVGFALARMWRARQVERRQEEDLRGLTEGLAVLAAELRSGRSLAAATGTVVASDATDGRALEEAVLGSGSDGHRDPAVGSALERVAAAASLSARTGCSLATVLTAVEDDLRARGRHRLELRASTSGPRAGAAVLAGLPLLGLAMGSGVGADPWRVLTTTPAGQALLVAGVLLELVGVWWSRRLIDRALR